MTNLRQRIQTIMQIRVHLKKFKIQLVIIFFVKLSLLIPELLYPIVYKIFIDDVIAEQRMNPVSYTHLPFMLSGCLLAVKTILSIKRIFLTWKLKLRY